MSLTDMEQAISAADAELQRADAVASSLARLLRGRLRKVGSAWLLADLKRELKSFNIHTKSWVEP